MGRYNDRKMRKLIRAASKGDIKSIKSVKECHRFLGCEPGGIAKESILRGERIIRAERQKRICCSLDNRFDEMAEDCARLSDGRRYVKGTILAVEDPYGVMEGLASHYGRISGMEHRTYFPDFYEYLGDDEEMIFNAMMDDISLDLSNPVRQSTPFVGLAENLDYRIELLFSKGNRILSYVTACEEEDGNMLYKMAEDIFDEDRIISRFSDPKKPEAISLIHDKSDFSYKDDLFYPFIKDGFYLKK